jgi:hypothetical protein
MLAQTKAQNSADLMLIKRLAVLEKWKATENLKVLPKDQIIMQQTPMIKCNTYPHRTLQVDCLDIVVRSHHDSAMVMENCVLRAH